MVALIAIIAAKGTSVSLKKITDRTPSAAPKSDRERDVTDTTLPEVRWNNVIMIAIELLLTNDPVAMMLATSPTNPYMLIS